MVQNKGTKFNRIVFCDFDGTLTAVETLVGVFSKFTPELFNELGLKLLTRELTLRKGVRRLLESIPSFRYPEIIEYTLSQPLRPGFEALLDFLDDSSVPFVIVSGGLRGMVEAKLGKLKARVHEIYAVDVDTNGEYLKVYSDFEGDEELVAKVQIMQRYEVETSVAIGDGITDLNMAKNAKLVFARDSLARYLTEANIPFTPWNTFHDIRNVLASLWK